MPDYLVKLYDLPSREPALQKLRAGGLVLRRALAPEKSLVLEWVRRNFSSNWADECDVAFARQPAACLIVTTGADGPQPPHVLGFACYNTVFQGFFGPTGTAESARGRGIGTALLLAALHAMWEDGYAYAIIGSGGGAEAFYRKTVGAVSIAGSDPGAYQGLLFPLAEDAPPRAP